MSEPMIEYFGWVSLCCSTYGEEETEDIEIMLNSVNAMIEQISFSTNHFEIKNFSFRNILYIGGNLISPSILSITKKNNLYGSSIF